MWPNNNIPITLKKDQVDYTESVSGGVHTSMDLAGRNGKGIYEPKVADEWGYTMHSTHDGGFPAYMSFGFTDVVKPQLGQDHPFRIRVGICYKTATGTVPTDGSVFNVQKGVKSMGSPNGNPFTGLWMDCNCSNLPSGATYANCPHNASSLTLETDWDTFEADSTGNLYFYDASLGMLFLHVIQNEPNTEVISPTGASEDEYGDKHIYYYSCPAGGCQIFTVRINDASYAPSGPTNCSCYPKYNMSYPANSHFLARVPHANIDDPIDNNILDNPIQVSTNQLIYDTDITRIYPNSNIPRDFNNGTSYQFPYNQLKASKEPYCPTTVGNPN